MSFTILYRDVAKQFLQSAIVFDDEASFGPAELEEEQLLDSTDLIENDDLEATESEAPHELVEPTPVNSDGHEVGVNAKALGDAFARL